MYVYTGRATKPAAVGEGAAGAREKAEATGGGFWEAGRAGGDAKHSYTICRGGQTHIDSIQSHSTQEMC